MTRRSSTEADPPAVPPHTAALAAAAQRDWARLTGLRPGLWLGRDDPHTAPLVAAARAFLAGGATAAVGGAWVALRHPDGRRLVLAAHLLVEAQRDG